MRVTNEARLLLACAQTNPSESAQATIRECLRHEIDWAAWAGLAQRHGVAPLAFRSMDTFAPEALPGRIARVLGEYVHASAMLNRLLADELGVLLKAFAERSIDVMPVKGPTLALMAYRDLTLREFDDLDLVVRKTQIPQARQVLIGLGYALTNADDHVLQAQDEAFHLFRHVQYPVYRVDLQWVMASQFFGFRLDRAQFWERRRGIVVAGYEGHSPSYEDLLIVLCVHGSKHAWTELKWTCDVAELLKAHPILDWKYIERTARGMQSWRLVLTGLAMAWTLFGALLPPFIRDAIVRDPDIPDLAERMPESLLSNPEAGVAERDSEAFYFALKDSMWNRWRFGLCLCHADSRAVLTPPPWMRQRRALRGLYRILNPVHRLVTEVWPSGAVRQKIARWLSSPG